MAERRNDFILFGLSTDEYSFRGLKYLIYLYFGSLLIAAILSGPIFLGFLNIDNDVCRYIASKGIDKTFDRIRLIFIICMFPFFFRKCGIRSLKNLGFDYRNFHEIFTWSLVGICFMVIFELTVALFEGRNIQILQGSWNILCGKLPKFLFSALLVSVLEEIIFRGIVLRIFYTAFSADIAIILSSLLFAYLHIKIPHIAQTSNDAVGIFSGFRCIIPMLFGFLYKFDAIKFLEITIFGIVLSKLVIAKFWLNRAIGLHAGIVFAMFVLNVLF